MAKTDFVLGTVVSPEFLDTIFYTAGGHKHDGLNDDGHAAKVLLSAGAEVQGILPTTMITPHVHDGAAGDGHQSKIDLASASHVTGALPLANQVSHVHDGVERTKVNLQSHAIGSYTDVSSDVQLSVDNSPVNLAWGPKVFHAYNIGRSALLLRIAFGLTFDSSPPSYIYVRLDGILGGISPVYNTNHGGILSQQVSTSFSLMSWVQFDGTPAGKGIVCQRFDGGTIASFSVIRGELFLPFY